MPERIGDLTMDELEKLVNRIVDERLKQTSLNAQPVGRRDPEFIERLKRHLIERDSGVPSPTELLLEEREMRRTSAYRPRTGN